MVLESKTHFQLEHHSSSSCLQDPFLEQQYRIGSVWWELLHLSIIHMSLYTYILKNMNTFRYDLGYTHW